MVIIAIFSLLICRYFKNKKNLILKFSGNVLFSYKFLDVAVMDFCVFILKKKHIIQTSTYNFSWILEDFFRIRGKVLSPILRKTVLSWKLRCRKVVKCKCHQIQHLKQKKNSKHHDIV